jgi:hypothetical protein
MKVTIFFLFTIILLTACATPIQETQFIFFGDQGLSTESSLLLQQISDDSIIIHLGDYDYLDRPDLFEKLYENSSAPLYAVAGNHDLPKWSQYLPFLQSKADQTTCYGDYGINYACEFEDVLVVFSGIGTKGSDHLAFLDSALTNSSAKWKVCAWHKNQRLMQVGGKKDEVGWDAYDICRAHGAIIATGHEHSYSRTFVMNNFTNQSVSSFNETLSIAPGETFAFVSGIGGKGVRVPKDDLDINAWWAKTYTANDGAKAGALFCTFGDVGFCEFKTEQGVVIDNFTIVT